MADFPGAVNRLLAKLGSDPVERQRAFNALMKRRPDLAGELDDLMRKVLAPDFQRLLKADPGLKGTGVRKSMTRSARAFLEAHGAPLEKSVETMTVDDRIGQPLAKRKGERMDAEQKRLRKQQKSLKKQQWRARAAAHGKDFDSMTKAARKDFKTDYRAAAALRRLGKRGTRQVTKSATVTDPRLAERLQQQLPPGTADSEKLAKAVHEAFSGAQLVTDGSVLGIRTPIGHWPLKP